MRLFLGPISVINHLSNHINHANQELRSLADKAWVLEDAKSQQTDFLSSYDSKVDCFYVQ